MDDSKAIVVKDIVKHYGDVHAVDGVSFDVRSGEIFSLLGPNGAGKTTAISMAVTMAYTYTNQKTLSLTGTSSDMPNMALSWKLVQPDRFSMTITSTTHRTCMSTLQ